MGVAEADTVAASSGVGTAVRGTRSGDRGASVEDTLPAEDLWGADQIDFETVDQGRYAIGPELARGGMGRILHARDRRHGRESFTEI